VLKVDKGKRVVKAKHSSYLKVTPTQRVLVARCAAENGFANMIRHFQRIFPKDSLKEITIT